MHDRECKSCGNVRSFADRSYTCPKKTPQKASPAPSPRAYHTTCPPAPPRAHPRRGQAMLVPRAYHTTCPKHISA